MNLSIWADSRLDRVWCSTVAFGPVITQMLMLGAEEPAGGSGAFLGEDLMSYLVLALGAALVAGNVAAIVRPPEGAKKREGDLERAPIARSVVMAVVGLIAAVWALASLVS